MFDMGFIKDLRYILRQLPPFERRQSLLFSATLSFDVMELAYVFMNEPVKVSVTPEQVTAERVEHLVYHCGLPEKMHVLVSLLRREPDARVLVFTNMRRSAERIERTLVANGFAAAAITGDVDQRRRLAHPAEFKDGTLPILVATDVASRGLHIDGVTHVVNYDIPLDAGGLRPSGRPHGARRRVGQGDQPRVRGLRAGPRGHRGSSSASSCRTTSRPTRCSPSTSCTRPARAIATTVTAGGTSRAARPA